MLPSLSLSVRVVSDTIDNLMRISAALLQISSPYPTHALFIHSNQNKASINNYCTRLSKILLFVSDKCMSHFRSRRLTPKTDVRDTFFLFDHWACFWPCKNFPETLEKELPFFSEMDTTIRISRVLFTAM